MFDKVIKTLITAGLFVNAAAYLSHPARADDAANSYILERIAGNTADTARKIDALASGICSNSKLC